MYLKKFMRDKPDYVGGWHQPRFDGLPDKYDKGLLKTAALFYLFITSRESIKEGLKFKGRSEDRHGNAEIEGIVTNQTITFEKKYDKAAREHGGRKETMTYRGTKTTIKGTDTIGFYAGLITTKTMNPPQTFIMKSLL
jgi:hypothetical protein